MLAGRAGAAVRHRVRLARRLLGGRRDVPVLHPRHPPHAAGISTSSSRRNGKASGATSPARSGWCSRIRSCGGSASLPSSSPPSSNASAFSSSRTWSTGSEWGSSRRGSRFPSRSSRGSSAASFGAGSRTGSAGRSRCWARSASPWASPVSPLHGSTPSGPGGRSSASASCSVRRASAGTGVFLSEVAPHRARRPSQPGDGRGAVHHILRRGHRPADLWRHRGPDRIFRPRLHRLRGLCPGLGRGGSAGPLDRLMTGEAAA